MQEALDVAAGVRPADGKKPARFSVVWVMQPYVMHQVARARQADMIGRAEGKRRSGAVHGRQRSLVAMLGGLVGRRPRSLGPRPTTTPGTASP